MEIRVISLEEAARRRSSIDAQMRRAGLNFRFFDAISDPHDVSRIIGPCDTEAFLLNTGRLPQGAELACLASHHSLWQRCADQRRPMLILEDDAWLEDGFAAAVDTASRLVRRFGFLRLQEERRAAREVVKDCGGFRVVRYRRMTQGAMCYAVSPSVAGAFVRACHPAVAPVDGFIKRFWDHGQPLFGLLPYTVSASATAWPSQIGERRKAERPLAARCDRARHRLRSWAQRVRYNLG